MVWKRLLDLIEAAANDGREEFSPIRDLGAEAAPWITTLPGEITHLKKVRRLFLGTSFLERLPPEIGEMESLEELDAYRSYRLHWFPYELTRCARLVASRVSTRALYGNRKYRPPFPSLRWGANRQSLGRFRPKICSLCGAPFGDRASHPRWISLRVGTDVLPLLAFLCSRECVKRLPPPAERYPPRPHQGGIWLRQPSSR